MWPDENFVLGEKDAGGKGREGSLQINGILRALLAALTISSSSFGLMFRTFPTPLVVEAFGIVNVSGGLWDSPVCEGE